MAGWPAGGMNGGDCVDYIAVSQDKIGLVIGKGGDTIKSINQVNIDRSIDGYCIDLKIDRLNDIQMDGWMDGWMDG